MDHAHRCTFATEIKPNEVVVGLRQPGLGAAGFTTSVAKEPGKKKQDRRNRQRSSQAIGIWHPSWHPFGIPASFEQRYSLVPQPAASGASLAPRPDSLGRVDQACPGPGPVLL